MPYNEKEAERFTAELSEAIRKVYNKYKHIPGATILASAGIIPEEADGEIDVIFLQAVMGTDEDLEILANEFKTHPDTTHFFKDDLFLLN